MRADGRAISPSVRRWPVWIAVGWFAGTACARVAEVRPDQPITTACGRSTSTSIITCDVSGVLIGAELLQGLSTDSSRAGDRFSLELLDPVDDGAGGTLWPRGTVLVGRVVDARPSPFAGQPARLQLAVEPVRDASAPVPSLELAGAPLHVDGAWSAQLLGGLGGLAVGAGAALLVSSDNGGAVLAASLVGAGVGALAASWLGPRQAHLPAGTVVTLRVVPNESRLAQESSSPPCVSPAAGP